MNFSAAAKKNQAKDETRNQGLFHDHSSFGGGRVIWNTENSSWKTFLSNLILKSKSKKKSEKFL